ncbi:MAG: diguanylate cyclase [Acidobacteriota bacterium]|nr:MAG: diguanylate cyclase [Acidobacteriota bacterium]
MTSIRDVPRGESRSGADKVRPAGQTPEPAGRSALTSSIPKDFEPKRTGLRVAGGSFVIDRSGHVLAFDRIMERLTGWNTIDVVGRHKDLGFYEAPDERGVRRYRACPLFEGRLPEVSRTMTTTIQINGKDGNQYEAEVLISPVGAQGERFAVELKRLVSRIAPAVSSPQDTSRDEVTRLPSAAVFNERLRETLTRARFSGQPLSLLVVDVDGFSQLRRDIGEEPARDTLCRVGGILRALVRQVDIVSRLQRNKFGVLLEGAGRGDARHIGGRIRSTIEKFAFARPDNDGELRVTVSIGAACYPADGEDADELLRRADDALFEARRLGSNRVWCYVRRPRIPLRTPVFFDGPAAQMLGMSRDLSNSGLFVETADELPEGMRVGLTFQLPDEAEPVHFVGRVARAVPAGDARAVTPGLGIEFERYGDGGRRRIEHFIHKAWSAQT